MAEYIIITPVKNEEDTIWATMVSVTNQSELPVLWVIVDGGSTDRTLERINEFTKKYEWIHCISQKTDKRVINTSHKNVALAVAEGYAYARHYCAANNIPFEYIWTIDGDQVLAPDVCSGLIGCMSDTPGIGVASGQVYNPDELPDVYPDGELPNKRVYQRCALELVGGFPVTKYSYDTVLLAKFRMAGVGIRTYPEYRITNLRPDSGIERDAWKSYVQFGKARYYLGYSFPLLVMGCGYLVIHHKPVKAMGVSWGYLTSWVNQDEVIKDRRVWQHFHNERLREVLKCRR